MFRVRQNLICYDYISATVLKHFAYSLSRTQIVKEIYCGAGAAKLCARPVAFLPCPLGSDIDFNQPFGMVAWEVEGDN